MKKKPEMRKEKDSLGEVFVPKCKYYGAQTQRAFENFEIGKEKIPQELIQAHAIVKRSAAIVNCKLGLLEERLKERIVEAAEEVIEGKLDSHFPLVIWQSGSGTQFNMNVNEVIANRAIALFGGKIGSKSPVHPNDHVNKSQSTNDTVPSSMHIAVVKVLHEKLLPSLQELRQSLAEKSKEYQDIIKIGRTHLQDATPLTLGQEFSGYASQLELAERAIEAVLPFLYELGIGGTAVGTGFTTKKNYRTMVVSEIAQYTDYPFKPAKNTFSAMAAHDAIVQASGSLKTLAGALMKIANDIRWLGSGPRSGLGELILPANEPGSSIMPGKINPTQCEMVTMVACQIYGNDTTIGMAGCMGNFELNVFKPLLAFSLLQSINLLSDACRSFCEKCIVGLRPNKKKIQEHVEHSLMLVTSLSEHIGYDMSSKIALDAYHQDITLKEAAIQSGSVTEDQFMQWVRPETMIAPSDP